METWGLAGQRVQNFTLYGGTLWTAYLLLKAYQVTNNKNDLNLSSEIVKYCDFASLGSRDVTFLCGRAGVCAVGAVAARHADDEKLLNYYLSQFKEIKLPRDIPNELLYGRAGWLWACLFLNKFIGEGTVPSSSMVTFKDAINEMATNSLRCVAIAYRLYEMDKIPTDEDQLAQWALPEDDLILLAIVGIKDPCRPGVKDAVKLCTEAGVKVLFGSFVNNVVHTWAIRLKGPVYVAMLKPLSIDIAVIMGVMFLGETIL